MMYLLKIAVICNIIFFYEIKYNRRNKMRRPVQIKLILRTLHSRNASTYMNIVQKCKYLKCK